MAQHFRVDGSGARLHTMNREIVHRSVFVTRTDYRYFLVCMARAARADWFEIHVNLWIGTHSHHPLWSLRAQA